MRIGFDAKRYFFNNTGLGNYSRQVVNSLIENYSNDEYILFSPKLPKIETKNLNLVLPPKIYPKFLSSIWRSKYMGTSIVEKNIDVYHGLSQEFPFNIDKFKGKKLLTVHDLIYMIYPKDFSYIDQKIHVKKALFSTKTADKIVAVSHQTKNDIVKYLKVPASKIQVLYQNCDPQFSVPIADEQKDALKVKYDLPEKYIFCIGRVEERKNLLSVLNAMKSIDPEIKLISVGKINSKYFKKIERFLSDNKEIRQRVKFIQNIPFEEIPVFYSMAKSLIYPSQMEGFGIPIIEALQSKTQVVTSTGGCFEEVGGEFAHYCNQNDEKSITKAILKSLEQPISFEKLPEHLQKFDIQLNIKKLRQIYSQ